MQTMLSIIVPVYNTEKELDRCIKSILQQTFQDWELILIDDGSTDSSGDICEQYATNDKRIHVIHTTNQGQSAARNRGLELAIGQYVSFIDSDDEITPETYSKNITILLNHPELQVVQFATIEGYGEHCGVLAKFPEKYYKSNKEIQMAFLAHLPSVTASVCNKIFKKDVLSQVRFVEGHLHEDYTFIDQLVQKIDSLYISESGCYHYYTRHDSTTHSKDAKRYLDLLSCDISRLERRYSFPELKHLLLEQYIFVIRESQNIRYEFPETDIREYDTWIKRLRPPFSSIFRQALFKDKILFLIILIIGQDNFTRIYQKLLNR